MIQIIDIDSIKKLIGQRICSLYASKMDKEDGLIKNIDLNFGLEFSKDSFFIKSDWNSFFESSEGEVFYNYDVILSMPNNSIYSESTIQFKTSEVCSIKIYGRKINENDFIQYPAVYKMVKGILYTDDLFLFNCINGEEILIGFHPFFPHINIYTKVKSLKYFLNLGYSYELHHYIK